ARAGGADQPPNDKEAKRARKNGKARPPPAEGNSNRDGKRRGNGRRHEGDRLEQTPAEADHAAAQLRWWPRIRGGRGPRMGRNLSGRHRRSSPSTLLKQARAHCRLPAYRPHFSPPHLATPIPLPALISG